MSALPATMTCVEIKTPGGPGALVPTTRPVPQPKAGELLIKVAATSEGRAQVMQLVDVYRSRIVDVSPESLVIETTGTEDKIDSLLEVLRPYGVIEMVRTGRVEMARGIMQPTPTTTQPATARAAAVRDAGSGSV